MVKIEEFFKIKNYFYYIQGTLRYNIYYKYPKLKFLVPKYIWEQIEIRINSIDRKCYNNGYCKMCGCTVTALQFANKPCDKPCYPKMINKKQFKDLLFSGGNKVFIQENKEHKKIYSWIIRNNKFILTDYYNTIIYGKK